MSARAVQTTVQSISVLWPTSGKDIECIGQRPHQGRQPRTLKLKDWPPCETFATKLPDWFQDLLSAFPLSAYTSRYGVINLVSRLPENFVRPDLGLKVYSTYGSASTPLVGSTNLHLDISDAVNLLDYVGVTNDDAETQKQQEEGFTLSLHHSALFDVAAVSWRQHDGP